MAEKGQKIVSHPTQYTLLSRKPLLARLPGVYPLMYKMVYQKVFLCRQSQSWQGLKAVYQMEDDMVYQKCLYDRGKALPDKVLRQVYPFSVCTMQCLYFPLSRIMDKKNVMAAPHDPAINCVPVHRFLSLVCARLLSERL